jgi:acyl-CoA synthetase (AMP-forming)/AMP-acid ligase II
VIARVVLRAEASPAELRAFAAERLARFKVPKAVELADALPRTESGKLLRRELV